LPDEDIGGRGIRGFRLEAVWTYSAHAQW
jgi:hypothetical protein